MHDADGVPSRRRVKNSTLLRSRVESPLICFCFFHCLLDRGRFNVDPARRFPCLLRRKELIRWTYNKIQFITKLR